jgi:hypothetical protein
MRAWLKNWHWTASLLLLSVSFASCSKSKPERFAEIPAETKVASEPDVSRAVPRRTNPIIITNRIVVEQVQSSSPDRTNAAPTITCGPVQNFPCSSADGLQATIAVHVEDPDGDALSVVWNADGKDRYTQQVPAGVAPTSTNLTFSYTFTPGDHGVKVTVSDGTTSASCDTSVTVQKDTQAPAMACPGDIVVPVDPGQCTAIVTFAPRATDNCPDVTVNCDPPSGFAFPVGVTTVTCTAADAAGNTTPCAFAVAVEATNRCPQGEPFWRQNPGAWPLNSLTLGNQTYSKSQLVSLMHVPNSQDASVALAQQLISAALNIASGSNPLPICGQLAQAHSLLSQFSGKLPYRVSLSLAAARPMFATASALSSYNNGMLTPNCAP